jgi:hypothetical protein
MIVYRGDVRRPDSAVQQRCGNEHTVAARSGKAHQIVGSSYAATSQQPRAWCRFAHTADESEVDPDIHTDLRQIEHDDGRHTSVGRAHSHGVSRESMHDVGISQEKSISDVETEGDALTVDGRADVVERVPRLQRLEADDDVCGAQGQAMACAIRRRCAGIQPERAASG